MFRLVIRAPIKESGVMMRPIGRFRMEASPVKVLVNGWALRMPEIRRVVVPLLPQSKRPEGAMSLRMPRL